MHALTCARPCFRSSRRKLITNWPWLTALPIPTIGVWFTHNGSFNNPDALNTIGASVSIPLRIFDTNQGEKLRTKIDINRNEKLREAAETQVYSDVDSAYATLNSNLILLRLTSKNIWPRPCACATPFFSPISTAARRCSIS